MRGSTHRYGRIAIRPRAFTREKIFQIGVAVGAGKYGSVERKCASAAQVETAPFEQRTGIHPSQSVVVAIRAKSEKRNLS
jgi:hypothetical protein